LKLRKIIPPHIEIIYKLHPGEYDRWKKEYPWLQNNNISIIDSQHPDLYTLLSSALCQIGVYSTAIYEGLAFGCQTFLVDLPGIANMDQLLESGYAQLVTRPEEINLNQTVNSVDTEYFFASNWKKNLENAVAEILTKKREHLC
jgi:hypothetical protein